MDNNTTTTYLPPSNAKTLQSGYDLPVYGLENDQFYTLHIPALTCIFLSLCSVITILTLSFKYQSYKTFFSWTRSERFVVYLAVCDGLFNIAHTMDHLHIVITKNHVYPKELCEFYGFMLALFISAQMLMVNVVAINAFVLIYFRKQINYGKMDWRLLVYTFGVPFAASTVAALAGTLGPNGAFCYFDGVKGEIANIFFTTVPLLIILVLNSILYVLTWQRIHVETKHLKDTIGKTAKTIKASHKAARTMSLFVTAFLVQWWAMGLYGIWQIVAPVPHLLFQFVTTFSNVGGILNGVVFFIIRRRKIMSSSDSKENSLDPSRSLDSSRVHSHIYTEKRHDTSKF